MSDTKKTSKQAAVEFLNTLITIRNAPLLILGLTTIALVYPTATDWCLENLGDGFFSRMAANIVTMLVYMMLDGLLEIVLNYIDGQDNEGRSFGYYAFVIAVGCIALGGSGTLSIWSAPIIVALTDDTAKIGKDTKDLARMKLKNDSLSIASLGAIAAQALETEGARIESARKKAEELEKAAAATSHSSWYRDYQDARNNPRHWLWTCSGGAGCPKGYRDYRDGILAARAEGARIVADAQGLVASLGDTHTGGDRFIIDAIKSATVADSVLLARNSYLFSVKQKALITIEVGSMLAVIFITIMIVWGKKMHNVTLDREFITLFSVIRHTLDRVLTALYFLYSSLIDAIHPETLQNLVMIPVELAGNIIGRKARETREQLAIAEAERKKAEEQNRKEEEEARRIEAEREKRRKEEERQRAQDKERNKKTLEGVEKKDKDRILNAIRYQLKTLRTLDAKKDATKIAECKARINGIIADRRSGLAFLESKGYNCSVDWETGSVSAKLKA